MEEARVFEAAIHPRRPEGGKFNAETATMGRYCFLGGCGEQLDLWDEVSPAGRWACLPFAVIRQEAVKDVVLVLLHVRGSVRATSYYMHQRQFGMRLRLSRGVTTNSARCWGMVPSVWEKALNVDGYCSPRA